MISAVTRYFFRLFNGALLVLFLGSLWGGWYLSKQGFGRKWRKKVSEEFSRGGVEMTARRLTLDPLRGLVAQDVQVFSDTRHEEVVAWIDELRLDINYTRLLRNEPFLDALSLSEAEVKLDADPAHKNSGEFQIHHLAAQLYFQPGQWEIRRCSGESLGLAFVINGVIEHGKEWQAPPNPAILRNTLNKIPAKWLRALVEVHCGPMPGRLDLRFRANLAQTNWLQEADVRIAIPEVRWRGAHLRDFALEGDASGRVATLRKMRWVDDLGVVNASGIWRPGDGGELTIDSKGDAPVYFRELGLFDGLASTASARLSADVSWSEKPAWKWQAVGSLNAAQLIYRSVMWDEAEAQFSVSGGRCFLNGIRLRQKDGLLEGRFLLEEGRAEGEFTSTINPRSICLSFAKEIPPWLDDYEFGVNPWLQIQFRRLAGEAADWQSDGVIVFGRTSFRGAALTSAQANFESAGSNIAFQRVQVTRPEGQCKGEGWWSGERSELTLWNVSNTIDLVAVGRWIDPALAGAMEGLRLPRDTVVRGNGRLVWRENRLAQGGLEIDSPGVALFNLPIFSGLNGNGASELTPLRASVAIENSVFRVAPFVAKGGEVKMEGRAAWNLADQTFTGVLTREGESGEASWTGSGPWSKIDWKPAEPEAGTP